MSIMHNRAAGARLLLCGVRDAGTLQTLPGTIGIAGSRLRHVRD